jgi:hypothetical protein
MSLYYDVYQMFRNLSKLARIRILLLKSTGSGLHEKIFLLSFKISTAVLTAYLQFAIPV